MGKSNLQEILDSFDDLIVRGERNVREFNQYLVDCRKIRSKMASYKDGFFADFDEKPSKEKIIEEKSKGTAIEEILSKYNLSTRTKSAIKAHDTMGHYSTKRKKKVVVKPSYDEISNSLAHGDSLEQIFKRYPGLSTMTKAAIKAHYTMGHYKKQNIRETPVRFRGELAYTEQQVRDLLDINHGALVFITKQNPDIYIDKIGGISYYRASDIKKLIKTNNK